MKMLISLQQIRKHVLYPKETESTKKGNVFKIVGNDMRFHFLGNHVHATNKILTKKRIRKLIGLVDRGEVLLFP